MVGSLSCCRMSQEGVVHLIWIGYRPEGDAGFLKWRAGYGPVFDSFFFQFTFE